MRKPFRWQQVSNKVPADAAVGSGCDLAPSVKWGRNVRLGDGVRIGPDTVVLDNVTVEDGCFIGPRCVLGEPTMAYYRTPDTFAAGPTRIGRGSILRTGTIVYERVEIGEGFQCGPHVCIRENVRIGEKCSIGNNGDIQGAVRIGAYARLHSSVHVAEGTVLGKYVWIMPNVLFTNDNLFPVYSHPQPAEIGPYCAIGAGSVVYPDVRLGLHVVAAAGSHIKGEHGDYAFIQGNPARKRCDARKFFVQVGDKTVFPYPWPKQIDREYPWKDVPREKRKLEDFL